jgi:hypothetical protein
MGEFLICCPEALPLVTGHTWSSASRPSSLGVVTPYAITHITIHGGRKSISSTRWLGLGGPWSIISIEMVLTTGGPISVMDLEG